MSCTLGQAAASSAAQSEKVEKELQGLLVARPEGASEARSQKDDGAKDGRCPVAQRPSLEADFCKRRIAPEDLSLDAWQERMDSPISEAGRGAADQNSRKGIRGALPIKTPEREYVHHIHIYIGPPTHAYM